MNIANILHERALRGGDQTAIVDRARRVSFAELDRAASCAADDLRKAGLEPGMRAVLMAPMSIELYAALVGMFRLGVTAVFVDPSAADLDACVARVRPDAFLATARAQLLRITSPAVRAIRIKLVFGGGVPLMRPIKLRTSASSGRIHDCREDAPAIVTFTSGTTGVPKAAVRTHGFLVAQHRALAESLRLRPDGVDLTTLPIFLLANLASGLTSIIPDANLRAPGDIDPAPVLAQIRRERPTRTVASPALLERLALEALASGQTLDTFTHIFTGGAPVFPRTLDAIARAAPSAAVVAVYGSTEAEPIAAIERREISSADRAAMQHGAGLLVGTPSRAIDVRVLPDRWGTPVGPLLPESFDRGALPAGSAGEIVVAGDHVLRGYLDGLGDTETKIHAGNRVWHRTGDAGYFDQQGRLWLLGRCSAKVNDQHGTAYPFAVECAASHIPSIHRSAFLLHRGRRLLVIELRRDSPTDPRTLLRRELEWACLDDVVMVDRIPVDRRHNAKVDLPALLPQLNTGRAADPARRAG